MWSSTDRRALRSILECQSFLAHGSIWNVAPIDGEATAAGRTAMIFVLVVLSREKVGEYTKRRGDARCLVGGGEGCECRVAQDQSCELPWFSPPHCTVHPPFRVRESGSRRTLPRSPGERDLQERAAAGQPNAHWGHRTFHPLDLLLQNGTCRGTSCSGGDRPNSRFP